MYAIRSYYALHARASGRAAGAGPGGLRYRRAELCTAAEFDRRGPIGTEFLPFSAGPRLFGRAIAGSLVAVITSYSIHYTKLYDKVSAAQAEIMKKNNL